MELVRGEVEDDPWEESLVVVPDSLDLEDEPDDDATFAPTPAGLSKAKNYKSWEKDLKSYLYSSQALTVYKSNDLKKYSQAGETEGDFRIRLAQVANENRDVQIEKLKDKFASKTKTLVGRIESAEAAVQRERDQSKRATMDSVISFGSTLLGAVFGRKLMSSTSVSRASTSMRSATRAMEQRGDIGRAQEKVEDLKDELDELEQKFKEEVEELEEKFNVDDLEFEELPLRPRKTDIDIDEVALIWTPWRVDSTGIAEPLYELEEIPT